MNRIYSIALVLFLLSGCGSHLFTGIDSNYPDNWPRIMINNKPCGQLTGVYKNYGLANYSPKGGSPFLMYRFGMGLPTVEELMLIQTVKIECNEEKQQIIITARSDTNESTKTISLKEDGWRLENDWLYFPVENESEADALGGFISKREFRLAISEDGSLIGEERSGGVGLALWLIPMGGIQTFWFQWPRATTE